MSVNKYQPHLYVIPEDDANRQIANGFLLNPSVEAARIQVLAEAGGWTQVIDGFLQNHLTEIQRYPQRRVLLLLDCDNDRTRLGKVKEKIPPDVADRVFIIGTLSEPESLKHDLGSFETIGLLLAKDCVNNTNDGWNHKLLSHNAAELARMRQHVRPFLINET